MKAEGKADGQGILGKKLLEQGTNWEVEVGKYEGRSSLGYVDDDIVLRSSYLQYMKRGRLRSPGASPNRWRTALTSRVLFAFTFTAKLIVDAFCIWLSGRSLPARWVIYVLLFSRITFW